MPAYNCETHGKGVSVPLCRTALQALGAGRRIELVIQRDSYDEVILLCAACAARAPEALARGDDAFDFEGDLWYQCLTCLNEQLAATGYPRIETMIAASKRRPAGPERLG